MRTRFDSHHKLIEFQARDLVMARDMLRTFKWDPPYECPYVVAKKKRGGSYLLQDATGAILKRAFPPSQLKLLPGGSPALEQNFKVLQIVDHRDSAAGTEYLVKWRDSTLPMTWLLYSNFDDVTIVRSYWKGLNLVEGDVNTSSS